MKDGKHIDEYGTIRYYLNNQFHREDGPAIEWDNGDKEWWLNDQLHREDGPAVEYADGTKYWCLNGKFHREDGPAVCVNGSKAWYLRGVEYTEEEFKAYKLIKQLAKLKDIVEEK
ncbi:MAG: hypothetical protein WC523_04450 [Patescibacteria group bacterium]